MFHSFVKALVVLAVHVFTDANAARDTAPPMRRQPAVTSVSTDVGVFATVALAARFV
jgi:hypothetical protein